jgi:predicted dehydrogenase
VVYVATPHTSHADSAVLAIEHGKHVLVEKPFAVNAIEARRIVDAARAHGVFAMEAMWTRFLPHISRAREMVASGDLGDVRSLTADFAERFPRDPASRAYSRELAGGALLDLGIYPISLASMLFGRPLAVTAAGRLTESGVDSQTSVTLSYAGGQMAVLFTSIEAHGATRASINGTRARIEIEGDFLAPADMSVIEDGGRRRDISIPHEGRGLRHQAREVERCVREGLLESPTLPLDETIEVIETLDEIRAQIGVWYPADVPELDRN